MKKKKFYPNPRGFSSLQVQSWDKVSITFPYRCVKSVCRSEKYLLDCSSNSPFLLIRQARNNRKDMTTQEADKRRGRRACALRALVSQFELFPDKIPAVDHRNPQEDMIGYKSPTTNFFSGISSFFKLWASSREVGSISALSLSCPVFVLKKYAQRGWLARFVTTTK